MNKITLILFFATLFACKSPSGTGGGSTDCETMATVKDFTGLDGCKFLLVLENGDKLLPAKLPAGFSLADGQEVKFGYKEMKDAVSICMAEKMSVEVTCIEVVGGRPEISECYDTEDPKTVPWLQGAVKEHRAISVKKYRYRTNGWAYLLSTRDKQFLYDCQGTKLCEFSGFGPQDCVAQKLQGEGEGRIIWRNVE